MNDAVKHRKLAIRITSIAVGMFVFAVFAMPPMYDVICRITGLNGKTSNQPAVAEGVAQQQERVLNIQFIANTGNGMPWKFEPGEKSVRVHPGEIKMTQFVVENLTDKIITSHAIPSVSPPQATQYFKKTQCFCFERQTLDARGRKEMPVIFYLDPALPEEINTITLSYTLYNLDDLAQSTKDDI